MTYLSLFGERLKAARKSLNLNQAQAADLVGVSREYWGRCERGDHMPGGDVFQALASKGVDVNHLLTGRGDGFDLTGEEQLMLQYFRDASPAVRKAALGALIGAEPTKSAKSSSVKVGNISQTSSQEGSVQVGYAGGKVSVKSGKKA